MKEQHFHPIIEEKLKTLGKVTLTYKQRKDFVPDFIVESDNGKKLAVKVEYELHPRHLTQKNLAQKAFQLLAYLYKFDEVLYIAPYEELTAICAMLEQVGVKVGEKFHTADLGYVIGTEALKTKLQKIALELKKVRRELRDHGYKL
ncbi:hypothetical protein HXY33_05295 [Candidatus Bathyarchaeota archaeon]|nr:hypothetical protein [Candidatus Bathyarchaeota archaeon]